MSISSPGCAAEGGEHDDAAEDMGGVPAGAHYGQRSGARGLHHPLVKVKKAARGEANGHHFSVSRAIWYPVDTGLFVSASHDCTVKVGELRARWSANGRGHALDC